MLRKLYYILPPSFRLLARRLFFLPIDIYNKIFNKNIEMVPPRGLIYTGSGDFVKTGKVFLKLFIDYGNLKPHHRVLDIGSGIGRMARPLAFFLDENGSYEGFDLVDTGVKWCKKNISAKYPNFKFQKVCLLNDLYTSSGNNAKTFKFPYKDNEFDFVFLVSVFTHMQPDEVKNYLDEIGRVLKTNGRCLATFFILNDYTLKSMDKNFNFPVNCGEYRLMDKKVKAANVAYNEDYLVNNLISGNNMAIKNIIYGYWCNHEKSEKYSFQDIVVFEKL